MHTTKKVLFAYSMPNIKLTVFDVTLMVHAHLSIENDTMSLNAFSPITTINSKSGTIFESFQGYINYYYKFGVYDCRYWAFFLFIKN